MQKVGAPIQLTFTDAEFEEHFAHVAHMEAGGTASAHHEWLAELLAQRGLPPLPADFCWQLERLNFTLWEVAA